MSCSNIKGDVNEDSPAGPTVHPPRICIRLQTYSYCCSRPAELFLCFAITPNPQPRIHIYTASSRVPCDMSQAPIPKTKQEKRNKRNKNHRRNYSNRAVFFTAGHELSEATQNSSHIIGPHELFPLACKEPRRFRRRTTLVLSSEVSCGGGGSDVICEVQSSKTRRNRICAEKNTAADKDEELPNTTGIGPTEPHEVLPLAADI